MIISNLGVFHQKASVSNPVYLWMLFSTLEANVGSCVEPRSTHDSTSTLMFSRSQRTQRILDRSKNRKPYGVGVQ